MKKQQWISLTEANNTYLATLNLAPQRGLWHASMSNSKDELLAMLTQKLKKKLKTAKTEKKNTLNLKKTFTD